MTKTIIFDWGGVLTMGKHTSGIAKILTKRYNLEDVYLKLNPIMRFIDNDEISFEDFLVKVNLVFNTNIDVKEMKEIFAEAIHPNLPIIKFLKILKEKHRLIIISNNNFVTVEILKKEHSDMLKHFEKCYFSCELKLTKPKPEFFEYVIKDAKLSPEECIFIDDKEKNVKVAEELGIQGIWFRKNSDIDDIL